MALANITNNILTDSGILVTNLTPTSRTLTINGTTYDLSADRSWTIATGVGGSGTTNYLPKFTGTSTIGNSIITDNGYYAGFNFTGSGSLGGQNFGVDSVGAFQNNLGSFGYRWLVNNGTNELMRLNASGNLSIGNTNDTYRLDVTGRGRFTHTGGVPALDIRASDSNFALMSVFGNQTGDVNWLIMSGYPAAGDFTIRQSDTVNALTLAKTTGAATFSSSVTATTGLTVGSLGSGSDAVITLATNASGSPRTIYYKASTATINFTGTGGTDLMTLTNGGSLGIGTTSPAARLVVKASAAEAYIQHSDSNTLAIGGWDGSWQYIKSINLGVALTPLRIQASVISLTDGSVGVGTTAPKSVFDVSAQTPTVSVVSNLNSEATSDNQTLAAITFFKHYGIANGAGIRMLQAGGANNYSQAHLTFLTTNDGNPYTAALYERMRITSVGNVGIGTTSPSEKLHLNNSSGTGTFIRFQDTGGDGVYVGSRSNNLELYAGGSERMRITSGGNVGIGTTSPSYNLEVWTASSGSLQNALNVTNGANADFTVRIKTSETWIGPTTATPLIFANSSNTERMRITSGGELCVGRTTAYSAGFLLNVEGNMYASAALNVGTTIQTGAPTNGTAQPWRLGNAVSGSLSTNHYIIVEINGTTYTIPALQGLP